MRKFQLRSEGGEEMNQVKRAELQAEISACKLPVRQKTAWYVPWQKEGKSGWNRAQKGRFQLGVTGNQGNVTFRALLKD